MSRFDDVAVFAAGFLLGLVAASSRKTRPAAWTAAGPPLSPAHPFTGIVDALTPQGFDAAPTDGSAPTAEQITALYIAASGAASRAHEAILAAWSADPRSDALRQANSDMITYRGQLAQWSIDAILLAPDVLAAVRTVQDATSRLRTAAQEMCDLATAEAGAALALSALSDLVSVFASA